MSDERRMLSSGHNVAEAIDYLLKRWAVFARFVDDGRICLADNAADRGVRGIALGRKSWLFAGSDRGGQRAAVMYSLIVSAKTNDIDPQAWLTHVLANIAQHPASQLDELLPWNMAAPRKRNAQSRLTGAAVLTGWIRAHGKLRRMTRAAALVVCGNISGQFMLRSGIN